MAATFVVLLVFAGLGLRSYYVLHDKEAWDQVAAYVDRRLQRGDAIVFSVGFLEILFDLYHSAPRSYSVPESGSPGRRTIRSPCSRETRTRKRVWLIVSHPQPSTDGVIASLEGAGRLTEVAGFTDVDVYLYEIGEG